MGRAKNFITSMLRQSQDGAGRGGIADARNGNVTNFSRAARE